MFVSVVVAVVLGFVGLDDDKQAKKKSADPAGGEKATKVEKRFSKKDFGRKKAGDGRPKFDPQSKSAAKSNRDAGKQSKPDPAQGVKAAEDLADKPFEPRSAAALSALKFRSIGPAVTSGRVVGFGIHPSKTSTWYVAVACGGVWKTTNAGTTWTPIFDNEGSYSIGVVVVDPKNPNIIWVGTGENNSQRSVGYGDGVYKSEDAGRTWKNVGLQKSEHIGKILIDPRDSNVVYVAAQGPLWGPGGDRGLYKTTDGGKNWKQVLAISENTGVTDVVLDSSNPDVLVAASYQRRRHVWTLINGGPESALHRSTDGGTTWTKIRSALPGEEMGRIGLAAAPNQPKVVYAIVEAANKAGGIFRSGDFGVTWEKRNPFDQQAQYYSHIVVDPKNADRIYVMNVLNQVSDDGGRTLRSLGDRSKHVDSHEIWIDPNDSDHYLVGCDGGVYESFDRAATWKFHNNLPVTQFYDLALDNGGPFYTVYGGTQDNNTLGGPARNKSVHGITNADWFVTQGGDGFQSRVDPKDNNIVYSEAQYGMLVRFDRRTGESVGIQPQPGKGEPPLRWNWDSALIISPHLNTRLYFAANKLFRSDDRGNAWVAVSGDLTRQLNRDQLPVMGKIWNPDSVSKSVSTSFYGNIVALTESPKKEGVIYVGTDDGLIQVTENGGRQWRKIDKFPGVPDRTYVSRLLASQHDAKTIYATFENHKNADFTPYVLKSTDSGKTWNSIASDLPKNGPVLAIAEDHVDPDLLFVGTEFGLFVTFDGGKKWIRHKSGLPTIAVRDIAIQKQVNDLVLATFGRGFYVLDDYSAMREMKADYQNNAAKIFPAREAQLYVPTRQYGGRGKAFQGETLYTAENPPFGATFTYYINKNSVDKTLKQKRKEAEREAAKKKQTPKYPTPEQLRAEEEELPSMMFATVSDGQARVVRTFAVPGAPGVNRATWDLRSQAATLPRPRPTEGGDDFGFEGPGGPLVPPGDYLISISKRAGNSVAVLATGKVKVSVHRNAQETVGELAEQSQFQQKVIKLQRAVAAALDTANGLTNRLEQVRIAVDTTPNIDPTFAGKVRQLEQHNRDILRALRGDNILRARNENTPPSISERVFEVVGNLRGYLGKPTTTDQQSLGIASDELAEKVAQLRKVIEVDLKPFEKALDDAGAPPTPGRLPKWDKLEKPK